ncbi:MAG: tetratricopeptide repeat protein [Bacteroidales bacterium]|nr:tetratricopeptide repeat protein [Bacteroidales bacterium]
MKKANLIVFSGIMMMMVSCGPSREKAVQKIQTMETSLFSPEAVSFNKQKADSLLSMYEGFIKDHPGDSLSPGYLFKAANIVMNSGDGSRALSLFDKYLQEYPDKPKASISLFFKAFIYENIMHDLDKARETYLLFIEKYPSDDFVNDAQLAIVNLGKTPDMLIREFEAKNRADSLRTADSIATHRKPKKRS